MRAYNDRLDELLARVRLRLRDVRSPEGHVLQVGDVRLDVYTRTASVANRTVDLSARIETVRGAGYRFVGWSHGTTTSGSARGDRAQSAAELSQGSER
jgi:DNA-binding response OmpR family regulator